MKKQNLFPSSILEQSADGIFNEHSRLSGILYIATLLVVVAAIAAMNFIRVDVHVQAQGLIKPREDRSVITATASGFVRAFRLAPNTHVGAGDTLLIIRSELVTAKLPALEKRKAELDDLIADLKALTTRSPYGVQLRSPVYRQDVLYYIAQWDEADARRKAARQACERSRKLFEAQVIPLSEHEPVELEYAQAENAIKTLTRHQKRQWQSDLIAFEAERREVETQISQIDIQSAETVICSPVAGTILGAQALFDGSYITAGAQVAEISPDGDLIAECYVAPHDIGYIKPGMSGKVQVSAFNHTEWGMLQATVDEIFDDITVSADGRQSFYKIYCTLGADHLTLKNGYTGYIKKGMLVNANFIVTNRTLFQLLYDKLDKWLNPQLNQDRNDDETGN